MKYTDTFQRVEHKYLLTKNQAEELYARIEDHLVDDIYPKYSLHNVYYDSSDYTMIRHSIAGPSYKEKLRVRSYGEPEEGSFAYVEMKKKYAGIVYKRRIQIQEEEVGHCMDSSLLEKQGQIGREIAYMHQMYDASPKLFIAYDRRAYAGKEEADVRVTFDTNIRYRTDHLSLHDDYPDTYLLSEDQVLMEVKVMNRYPLWLSKALTEMKLQRTSFSKYGTIYTNMKKEERKQNYV